VSTSTVGRVTYITPDGEQHQVEVAPGTSLMQAATSHGVPGIEAECGGSLSCATCHVYVQPDWLDRLEPPNQAERQMLEFAEQPQVNSRLCCQIRFTAALEGIVVRVPEAQ
jgi:ferredoxin, 2Fe-2S